MSVQPVVGAAIDVGSTSVHLLVASLEGGTLTPIADESAFLGLGSIVDADGRLGLPTRALLRDTLMAYTATARALGAETVTIVATEPLRRAGDAARAARDVEAATGVSVHVLSHEEEAYLTLVGAMAGRARTSETLVVDIGGGSSEFCVVPPDAIPRVAGVRLGAERLTGRHVQHDPPQADEVDAMRLAADAALERAPSARPAECVVVGGTASNLLKVAPGGPDDRRLDIRRLEGALATVLADPADVLVERYLIRPRRARILPAGAVILGAILRRYDLASAEVAEGGIREGALRAAVHAGRSWRDRLPALAHGWEAEPREAAPVAAG